MKRTIMTIAQRFDTAHAAFYTLLRKNLKWLIHRSPKFGWQVIHTCEKLAENNLIQHAVIMLTIFVVSCAIYARSDRYFATTDALPNNLVALNILYNKRVDLTNLRPYLDKRDLKGIYVTNENGIVYPKTSIFLGIISAPFFHTLHTYWGIDGLDLDNNTLIDSQYSQYLGKMYASFLSATSAVFMYVILSSLLKKKSGAFWLALLYALCTNVFNIASQSSIQHAPSLFLITGALVLFFKDTNKLRGIFISSIILAFSTHIRISNGFYLAFLALILLMNHSYIKQKAQSYKALLLGTAIGYIPPMLYVKYLNIPNGYMDEILFSFKIWKPMLFLENLYALLFSYNYGLFFFSPVFLILCIIVFMRRKPDKNIAYLQLPILATMTLFISFAATWWMWSGGLSLGARLIIEAIPLAILLIGMYYDSLSQLRWFPIAVIILGGASLYINFLTSFTFDKSWHDRYTKPGHENQIRNAWYTNPPLLEYMMQNQFYYIEKLRQVEFHDKPALEVSKQRIWFSGYDQKLKKFEPKKVQILPIPK